jgi:hypothetical protein
MPSTVWAPAPPRLVTTIKVAPRSVDVQQKAAGLHQVPEAQDGVLDVEAIADGECNAAARSFFGQHGIVLAGI